MKTLIDTAKQVIDIQAQEVLNLKKNINQDFERVCQIIQFCSGKVVLMGMGKSGHIARKISATLASTGTSAFFVHPAEAGHGDLGMISPNDVVIAISYSGTSDEILMLAPLIKRLNVPLITMTGNPKSAMATTATVHLNVGVQKEACPHNLAPTTSTTVALVMGDAIAISLLTAKGFSADDFARTHPCGALGRRLLTSVGDIMHTGNQLPIVKSNTSLLQTLLVMTEKTLGFVVITDEQQQILGVFTDGDLRRVLQQYDNIQALTIDTIMSKGCHTIGVHKPAVLAVEMMEKFKINALPVIDENHCFIGAINTHSLLDAKII